MPRSTSLFSRLEDVGGDPLLRSVQQFAEVPSTAEDHVAEDEQAPLVAEDLERQVDGDTRAVGIGHLRTTGCITRAVTMLFGLVAKCNQYA